MYVARVLDKRDGGEVPDANSFGFGTFISMDLGDETIVGVICDSRLVNPEYTASSPQTDGVNALGDLRRDMIREQKALVGILLLGRITGGKPVHEVPQRVVPASTDVETMGSEMILAFHQPGDGGVQLKYLPNLIAQTGSLGIPLAKFIIGELSRDCSEADRDRLSVMAETLAWKHAFGDAGF
jgi:hypothetical protein